ncbi:MAG: DsbA family protein [Pseudomonadota bacterium]
MRFFALSGLTIAMALAACSNGEDANAQSDTAPTHSASADVPTTEGSDSEPRIVPAPEGSLAGGTMAMGSEDAPLTIIEYASLTCPGCAVFHAQILPEIKEKYIDTGKVRFEFREFPTPPKNLAYAGSYLARCAATTKGSPAYFAMIDTLFKRQQDWAYSPTPGETLEEIAAQAGINREALQDCFFREDVKSAVRANVNAGIEAHKVGQTPTFIVNDKHFDWGRSASNMADAIDAELAKLEQ